MQKKLVIKKWLESAKKVYKRMKDNYNYWQQVLKVSKLSKSPIVQNAVTKKFYNSKYQSKQQGTLFYNIQFHMMP